MKQTIEPHPTSVNYSDPGERDLDISPGNSLSGVQPEGSVGPTVIEQQDENPPPVGFELRTDGIYIVGEADDATFLCSPLRVLAQFRDAHGKNWGKYIEVVDPDGKSHEQPFANTDISKHWAGVLGSLTSNGLRHSTAQGASSTIKRLIAEWTPNRKLTTVEQPGWVDKKCNAFVLGSGQVIGSDEILLQSNELSDLKDGVRNLSTVEAWRENIGEKCAGNPLAVLAVSLAFSGPLIELLASDMSGGLHLRGASSSGKSTLQRLATSVWGSPALLRSWAATRNGLESLAPAANDMLLCLDEIAEISGKELGNSIYMLGNGKGKTRMGPFAATRPARRWSIAILSSGEIGVDEKLAEAEVDKKAGHEVRLVDIVADDRKFGAFDNLHGASSASAFSDQLKSATHQHFGVAGPAYVSHLIQSRVKIIQIWERYSKWFISCTGWKIGSQENGQIMRVAQRFALIAFAGDMATSLGITGWGQREASNAALEAIRTWQESLEDPIEPSAKLLLENIRKFLQMNASKTHNLASTITVPATGVVCWYDEKLIYMTAEAWKIVCGTGGSMRAARMLKASGALLPGEGDNLARRAPRSVPDRPRVYALRSAILWPDEPASNALKIAV